MQFFHNWPPQSYLHSDAPASDGEKEEKEEEKKTKNCSQNSAMRGMLNLCTNLVQI